MPSAAEELRLNTIRFLTVDAVEKAKSGHPGAPMGAAGIAYVLWDRIMRYNPADPKWCNRDRFILSAGHASMLLYAMLYLTGYDLTLEDIKNFRQWNSLTQKSLPVAIEVPLSLRAADAVQPLHRVAAQAAPEASLTADCRSP